MTPGRRLLPLLLASLALPACKGCERAEPRDVHADAAPPDPTPLSNDDLLPPPAPWTFAPARLGPGLPGVALPAGCRMRAPLTRAQVAASTRFVAAPDATGALVVADADLRESPPRLLGVAALVLSAEGASSGATPVPWLEADAMPRFARERGRGQTDDGAWLSAYAEPGDEKLSRVFVHKGDRATQVGEGDRFDAADLACGPSSCALLTTRLGHVAAAGAELFIGTPDEPASAWKRTTIVPDADAGESDARPACLAKVGAGAAVAALQERDELVFWSAEAGAPARVLGRVPAPHGMLDAIVADGPLALVYGSAVDDEGCAREGGKIRVERVGQEAFELRAHAPPMSGALRPLARGVLAVYLAPLGCGLARKVVYAVVLDEKGAPVSAPMPVADATSFAVAARGEDVDLWIQHGDAVTWVRAVCGSP